MSNERNAAAEKQFLAFDKIDPTHIAESLIGENGQSYKSFSDEQNLAMLGIHMQYNKAKEEMLKAAGDTTFSMAVSDYIQVIESIGFKLMFSEPVTYEREYVNAGEELQRTETFYVFAHTEFGIILQFDSYSWSDGQPSVNVGKWYAAWKPHDREKCNGLLSSGGWECQSSPNWRRDPQYAETRPADLVWVGDWDCREGVKSRINALLDHGTLFSKWFVPTIPFGLFQSGFDYYHPDYNKAKRASRGVSHYSITETLLRQRWERICAEPSAAPMFDILNGAQLRESKWGV